MTKHPVDHRSPPTAQRLLHFLRIARGERAPWHRNHGPASARRLVEFLRVARGWTV